MSAGSFDNSGGAPAINASGTGGSGGLLAVSDSGAGVAAVSLSGIGVMGSSDGADPGVQGKSSSGYGLFGTSTSGGGVNGLSVAASGVKPAHSCGVWGDSSTGYGVCATSGSTNGLWASSASDHGVHGETKSQTSAGVYGENASAFPCVAILGSSGSGHGVKGVNGSGSGKAPTKDAAGVWGDSDQGYGVYGASKSGDAGMFDGNVTVTGHLTTGDVILTAGGDCAERFDLSAAATADPGTVMVIGEDGALRPSEQAYDRRVAGVVSGAGAFRPGIVLDKRAEDEGRATIALVGKVYCKVDADAAPIAVGDLLTTSAIPGHAMKAADRMQAFGAVIGKALAPLERGRGLIPILVALQ